MKPGESVAGKGSPGELPHPKYRPDIDGLRAIAVSSVVVYHAFPGLLPGGFTGVDIFFVISGYLISSIIMEGLETGKFSFLTFYSRRIKRILPALLMVLASVLVVGWLVLFADEYRTLGKHVLGGATFTSNVLLWREVGYFDVAAEFKPLLHLWSLAIEEQFYLVWPLLLWLGHARRIGLSWLTLSLTAVSLAAGIVASYLGPLAAFYSPGTRFWELGIGCTLAHFCRHPPRFVASIGPAGRDATSVAGALLLGLSLTLIDSEDPFPGWVALLPTIGTAMVIASGRNALVNRIVLAIPILVWIGLISFPLYLWHWPLISISRIVSPDPLETRTLVVLIAVAVALSWATYALVENRIRWRRDNATSAALLLVLVSLGAMGTYSFSSDGFMARRINAPLGEEYFSGVFERARESDDSCSERLGIEPLFEEVCLTNSSSPTTMFIGDSHAMSLYSAIHSGKIATPSLLVAAHSCRMLPNFEYDPDPRQTWGHNCKAIGEKAISMASALPTVRTVYLVRAAPGVSPPTVFRLNDVELSSTDSFLLGNRDLVLALQAAGKEVVFVMDVPLLRYEPRQCIRRTTFVEPKTCSVPRSEFEASRAQYTSLVRQLASEIPRLRVVDLGRMLCRGDQCAAGDTDGFYYQDADHLTVHGSEILLEALRFPVADAQLARD